MPTLDEINEQLKNLDGVQKLFGKKEIKELPNILWEDEKLEKLVQGVYNNGQGILIATNKRLIFIDKGFFWGLKVEEFPYDKISSIQYETGMIFGKITIFASGNKAEIEQLFKDSCRSFCDYVRARISSPVEHASKKASSSAVEYDIVSQLEGFAKLRDQGILTQEEFDAKKKQLLGL